MWKARITRTSTSTHWQASSLWPRTTTFRSQSQTKPPGTSDLMVKIANSGDVSDDMFRLLSTSKYTKGQSDISVTELIAPPRIRQLLARHGDKIEVDASDSIYALFGTLTHEIMQNVKLGLAGKNSDRRLAAIHETLVDLEDKKIELIDLPAKLQEAINKADEEEVYARHKRIIERRFF